ncbi:fumarylacetoacetate hydrolase family protein [Peribacillus sp. TH16]|uniref:2-keto-4-pentenoate hydratase n=1 Tax=unclassified Peribacillus TaxID=2675266 RepID=UPI001914720C|nr:MULTISPECIES: fumarylacetoacetate hydrolase family protein [unclassified Peribacillus]MBK5458097.1 fumarylacetoacetate hydrolase family protein [Peribacillus sp. TH27]MBK5482740.1 fumarylacetoacetate hydrolase family protein [Peribacillus sp. TH16]
MSLILEALADKLIEAERSKQPLDPLTQQYPELSVTDAYQIQIKVMEKKRTEGRWVIGKKVGLTSVAMQKMLGVNEPDYGHLLDDMEVKDGEKVKISDMISPKVEAEIGFILGQDLVGPNVTYLDVLMATKYVVPTIEIIDSRITDWKIQLIDTVADNGSSAKVVVGNKRSTIDGLDLRSVGMALYNNEELVATGSGAAALGHPAQAIAWLANKLHEFGIQLKAGELILPGALSGALTVKQGDTISAHFGPLGSVSVAFE